MLKGCFCQESEGNHADLMVRWTIGLASTPVYHVLDAFSFLILRSTLKTLLGGKVQYRQVFDSILSVGLVVPVQTHTSVIKSLNTPATPTVAAANGQWRYLLADLGRTSATQAVCIQFNSATKEELKKYLMNPDSGGEKFRIEGHSCCEFCVKQPCQVLTGDPNLLLLERYAEVFFNPITAILENASRKSLGIYTDYFDSSVSPPNPTPHARPISV